MFHQPDLFEQSPAASRPPSLPVTSALPDLVERISTVSKRRRYALLVLKLIAQEAGSNDSVGPYVGSGKGRVPVRDWLCQALAPLAQRDCRRRAMIDAVHADLMSRPGNMADPEEVERQLEQEVQSRILRSGRTNVSRVVSDLVRAGLLRRHYQGYRVDHPNRGAQREAVYTITPEAKRALQRH
ncbi:hypothetical protein [Sphingobium sp. SA916]|uniref:hypothetical protein n=1 Tax=Sphingobium sp. SA916 TaxID=1851207 RepID=UPI000C9FBCAA|nr:hypothetical protein [Sphingobium sp. SA916]PNQ04279.1 hypothetical protein A8G00_08565 [Sphingobium sp. SA916]